MVFKTELEAKNEKLILNEKCFKNLSEQTNKVIFECDFDKNKISSMTNFQALFGRESVTQNAAADALTVKAVHTDDQEVFTNIFEEMTSGNPMNDAHFRIVDVNGVYHWCSLSGVVIKDDKGKPYKATTELLIKKELAESKNKDVKNAQDSFREKGFYIVNTLEDVSEVEREILERQNIKSMVLFGMIRKGEPIGFDDCLNQRIPTSRACPE